MKKLVVLLLLGVSGVSFASVVPTEPVKVRRPSVTQPDATKMKMLVKHKVLEDTVGSESVPDLQRYHKVVTLDNVTAIENTSRLMQDNPQGLMRKIGVDPDKLPFELDRRAMGTEEIVGNYVASPQTDDPGEKLAGLHVPELTGSFKNVRQSENSLKNMHKEALKQIEEVGHRHLGQKEAPIQRTLTPDDIKDMGIDTRRLPKDWEETLEKAIENNEKHKDQVSLTQKQNLAVATKKTSAQQQQKVDTTKQQNRSATQRTK